MARLSSEAQFYRDVAIAINQQDQQAAAEYLRRSQVAEEELLFRIRDLQRELEEEEEENRNTIIFTPGGY